MVDGIWLPAQAKRDAGRLVLVERLAKARELAKVCMEQLDELEAASKKWRVRPDHPEGIYLRNLLTSSRTFNSMAYALPELIESLAAVGEAQLLEMRNQSERFFASILEFERFVGTMKGAYDSRELLGVERTVNQAINTLVTQLGDAIHNMTKLPPKRKFKIDRAWWVVASSIGGLFALYLVTSMTGSAYRFDADQLASGFKACSYNGVVSGKKIFCPRADFEAKPTGATLSLSNENKPHKEPPPGYDGMRY